MYYQYFIGKPVFSLSLDFETEHSLYKDMCEDIKMQFAKYQIRFIKHFANLINYSLSTHELNEIQKVLMNNIELKIDIIDNRWVISHKEKSGSITIKQITIFNNCPDNKSSRKNSTLDFCFDLLTPTGVWCRDVINSTLVKMFFDHNYKLAEIFYEDPRYGNKGSSLSYEEEEFKFQHRHLKNIEEIKVLLPELFVIGVYDFTSEDFDERYQYYNLMQY